VSLGDGARIPRKKVGWCFGRRRGSAIMRVWCPHRMSSWQLDRQRQRGLENRDGAAPLDRTQGGVRLFRYIAREVAAGASITLKLRERLTFISMCRPARGCEPAGTGAPTLWS
jgi:hypothetical protein